eukprot:5457932-Amphidinium_carterae.1
MWPQTGGRGAKQRQNRAPPQVTLRTPKASGSGDVIKSEESRPTYLDIPPTWDGRQAESSLEGYLKAAEAWLKTTRVPVQQRGVQLLSQATGDLRALLSTLELDQLTNANGGELIVAYVRKQYEWVL